MRDVHDGVLRANDFRAGMGPQSSEGDYHEPMAETSHLYLPAEMDFA
jgi:hypothetical protein